MKRPTPTPGPFSLAVRDQLNLAMRRRGESALSLSERIPRGKSYLAERLNNDEKAFTLTDLELICGALQVDVVEVVKRAQQALAFDLSVPSPTVIPDEDTQIAEEDLAPDDPAHYSLAAKKHEELDVNEEDYP